MFWRNIKNKGKVTLGTFLNFSYGSIYLQTKRKPMKMMLHNIWGDISGYISTKVWNLAAPNKP